MQRAMPTYIRPSLRLFQVSMRNVYGSGFNPNETVVYLLLSIRQKRPRQSYHEERRDNPVRYE
jgi:hypothetical protein